MASRRSWKPSRLIPKSWKFWKKPKLGTTWYCDLEDEPAPPTAPACLDDTEDIDDFDSDHTYETINFASPQYSQAGEPEYANIGDWNHLGSPGAQCASYSEEEDDDPLGYLQGYLRSPPQPVYSPPRCPSPYQSPPRCPSPYQSPPRCPSPYQSPPRCPSPYQFVSQNQRGLSRSLPGPPCPQYQQFRQVRSAGASPSGPFSWTRGQKCVSDVEEDPCEDPQMFTIPQCPVSMPRRSMIPRPTSGFGPGTPRPGITPGRSRIPRPITTPRALTYTTPCFPQSRIPTGRPRWPRRRLQFGGSPRTPTSPYLAGPHTPIAEQMMRFPGSLRTPTSAGRFRNVNRGPAWTPFSGLRGFQVPVAQQMMNYSGALRTPRTPATPYC